MKKALLFCLVFVCAEMVFASIGSKWESLYNKDVKNLKEGFFDVHFPAKYVAPGPDPAVTQIVAQVAIQLSPEEYARAKEDLARREKELAEAEKKVNKLKEEYDEEALEYAELRLKQAKAKRDEVQSKIKSADLWTEEQRLKKLKKTVKKPVSKETHLADSEKYFSLRKVMRDATTTVGMMNFLGEDAVTNIFPWPDQSIKVYVVTDKAAFKKIASKEKLASFFICPVENIVMDQKGKEMLVYVDHKLTNNFQAAFSYMVCGRAFDEFMEAVTVKDGAGDAIRIGYCANAANLNVITTLDGDFDLPVLDEKKLFLASQIIDPGAIPDRERCLYYLRQAKALSKAMTDIGESEFTRFLMNAKGGNSRMRWNFENIKLTKEWGDGFDTFCQNLQEKAFLPLTKKQ